MRHLFILLIALISYNSYSSGLDCGKYKFPKCENTHYQFHESFDNKNFTYGGFGGGNCVSTKTPVIFIHGNGDNSINWDYPSSFSPNTSIYDVLIENGYTPCDLFGVTYLSKNEQILAQNNTHNPEKYKIILNFIEEVKNYTGKDKVDIIGHSLGSTMSMAALKYGNKWNDVNKFINIAGGIRGLESCSFAQTCRGGLGYEFGFHIRYNRWTAPSGEYSLREMPKYYPDVKFYTLHAGKHDQIHCGALSSSKCHLGALYNDFSNVKSQLDLGEGSVSSFFNINGGDLDGVGHYKIRNNSGQYIYNMLDTDCSGQDCK